MKGCFNNEMVAQITIWKQYLKKRFFK